MKLDAKSGEVLATEKATDPDERLELAAFRRVCDILLVNTRYLIEVCLEGRAGHLVELELETGVREREGKEEGEDDDELKEISYNFFAQDARGNVYYFGEDVDDYNDGKVMGHGGAWRVGKNAKEPCLFMPAEFRLGFAFKRENSPPAAEEFDEVAELDARLKMPAGAFAKVLVIKEADRRGQWKARKYYAPGVGLVSENRKLNLTEYRASSRKKND